MWSPRSGQHASGSHTHTVSIQRPLGDGCSLLPHCRHCNHSPGGRRVETRALSQAPGAIASAAAAGYACAGAPCQEDEQQHAPPEAASAVRPMAGGDDSSSPVYLLRYPHHTCSSDHGSHLPVTLTCLTPAFFRVRDSCLLVTYASQAGLLERQCSLLLPSNSASVHAPSQGALLYTLASLQVTHTAMRIMHLACAFAPGQSKSPRTTILKSFLTPERAAAALRRRPSPPSPPLVLLRRPPPPPPTSTLARSRRTRPRSSRSP
jgi:hypothetical protein